MPPAAQLLVVVVALAAFWFVVMRPARVQQRKVVELQQALQVGDEVVLSAGIFGTVRSLSDARVDIEIAPGTVITVARQVVVRRVQDLPDQDRPAEPGSASEHPTDPDHGQDPRAPRGPADPTQD
ncbi:preprotein translocase subunit YajC [Marmoricola sp. Leaf446]|uniref:preprotein translocase subunit YajC n=1 Tax=Marmoricola sp. Leaf446 TaxID=1736379 RepID=UPI0006F341C8|nr:preprotein translocase subunit YajC [Marmoricola sp. Leaf446]